MSYDIEHIFNLLPAYHRERDVKIGEKTLDKNGQTIVQQLENKLAALTNPDDAEAKRLQKLIDEIKRGPLKAILSLFLEQMQLFEENLEQMYDDQFIETCADWVVPYIGDLVGTGGLLSIPDMPYSQRAQVANTIAYRRRKGTAAVVEQLARDITGWPAKVVEYFQLLGTTQYMNHIRPGNLATAPIRSGNKLAPVNTPFDTITRSADVRSIDKKRGRYNLPNLGIYLWKNSPFSSTESSPCQVDNYRYCFDILGNKLPLFHLNESEDDISDLAGIENIPHSIKRRFLHGNPNRYYGKGKSLLLTVNNQDIIPTPSKNFNDLFVVTNLDDELDSGGMVTGWKNMPNTKIAIDPELGRMAFPGTLPAPSNVKVTYHYGALAEYGGGEYGKSDSFISPSGATINVPTDAATIQEAINQLNTVGGIIQIEDSIVYDESPVFTIAPNIKIELRAANKKRPAIRLSGEMVVFGGANSELSINGVLIFGEKIRIPNTDVYSNTNQLSKLDITHTSLRSEFGTSVADPPAPALINECPDTAIVISKSFIGGIRSADTTSMSISSSVVDSGAPTHIAISGTASGTASSVLTLQNVTIVGKVHTLKIENASNCIFYSMLGGSDAWHSPLITERLQEGCVRYSFVPQGAIIPRPYRCISPNSEEDYALQPIFVSLKFGNPYYGQLSERCSKLISEGSEENSEMGVFHEIYSSQRIQHLKTKLKEYMYFGLESGIFLI